MTGIPESKPEYVFIYGTLLPGLRSPPSALLTVGWQQVGRASLCGVLYDVGSYPGAIPDVEAQGRVRGVVFELPALDSDALSRVDAYEGFDPDNTADSLFLRRRVSVSLDDARRLHCWMWVYNRSTLDLEVIPHGDFLRWCEGTDRR